MEMMNKKSCLVLILISCFVSQIIDAKKQTDALNSFYKAKMFKNSFIDRSHFEGIHVVGKREVHFSQEGKKERDKIVELPGQPPRVDFDQYGGYVTVDESAGRAFYYYFVEAPKSVKNSLPLLLWLNGGPGCSSIGGGAMNELGPFRVHSDGKTLFKNKYAWNNAANVLFLESPAGVGFSYSNKTSDYLQSGDGRTAADNYVFLLNWLEKFPEYKNRDFYIAGQSYAGHYIPQLAQTILSHNKKATKTLINLKGIIIGNPAINNETDSMGEYEYLASHALISDELNNRIHKNCSFPLNYTSNTISDCLWALIEAQKLLEGINPYHINEPMCSNYNLTTRPKKASIETMDPCSSVYVRAYLNRGDVQKALHANVTKLSHEWKSCSSLLDWHDRSLTTIPLLRESMANGLRVWIYSGDMDSVVSVTSTKNAINKMMLSVKTPWRSWLVNGKEVGGYVQEYKEGLTFATVRGAGHEVPSYQPIRALSLIKHFISGTLP